MHLLLLLGNFLFFLNNLFHLFCSAQFEICHLRLLIQNCFDLEWQLESVLNDKKKYANFFLNLIWDIYAILLKNNSLKIIQQLRIIQS